MELDAKLAGTERLVKQGERDLMIETLPEIK